MAEVFNPSMDIPSFEEQNVALARQQKLADFLRKQAAATKSPEGQMVGGQYIRPHFLQELAPIIGNMNADWAENKAGQMEQNNTARMLAAANQWESQMPQPVPGTPGVAATPFGSRDTPQQDAVQATPEVPVTRQQALKYTMQGLRNPMTKDAAILYNKGFSDDLTREDNQLHRRETLQATLAQQRELKLEQLRNQELDAQRRSEDQRASIEQRREAAAEAAQARRDVAAIMAAASQANAALRADKPKELKNVPATMAKAYVDNESSIKQIDDTIAAVKANPKAFGLSRIGPNDLNELVDKKGIDARSKVAQVGSIRRHEISGAAVTVAEDKKLAPWLPAVYHSPESIITKLKNIRSDLTSTQDSIDATVESQGYKPLRNVGETAPPPAVGGLTPAEAKELADLKARLGK